MLKIKPIGKAYWIDIDLEKTKEQRTATGLFQITTNENSRPETGRIIAIGDEVKYIKPGDLVLYRKFNISREPTVLPDGTEVIIGADYEKDILAIIEENE